MSLQKITTVCDQKFISSALRVIGDFVADEQPYDVELVNLGLIEAILPFLNSTNFVRGGVVI